MSRVNKKRAQKSLHVDARRQDEAKGLIEQEEKQGDDKGTDSQQQDNLLIDRVVDKAAYRHGDGFSAVERKERSCNSRNIWAPCDVVTSVKMKGSFIIPFEPLQELLYLCIPISCKSGSVLKKS